MFLFSVYSACPFPYLPHSYSYPYCAEILSRETTVNRNVASDARIQESGSSTKITHLAPLTHNQLRVVPVAGRFDSTANRRELTQKIIEGEDCVRPLLT